MRRTLVVYLFGCLLNPSVRGQSPSAPGFEVADIRVNTSGGEDSSGDISNGRLVIRNPRFRSLIAEAMMTRADVVGPSWLDDVRVDIVAKAASPTAADSEVRQVLLTLLRERLKLVFHVEQREKTVWALTVWTGRRR